MPPSPRLVCSPFHETKCTGRNEMAGCTSKHVCLASKVTFELLSENTHAQFNQIITFVN